MLYSSAFSISLLVACSIASPLAFPETQTSRPACNQLQAAFPQLVSLPGSGEYANRSAENWSLASVQSPYCIFEPTTAQNVAAALNILRKTDTKFAVRSGGHMPVPGASSITNGVLFSMNKMSSMSFANGKKIAQLGPGGRWGDVYNWISPFGLAVAGGRFGPVGVSGLLLGGGINYFGNTRGWSANGVVNYEVVLADGTIVNANSKSNSDLFWALKGGSSNFGIVTRFDMETFPLTDIYAGQIGYAKQYTDDHVKAIAKFVSPGGGDTDPSATINSIFLISPNTSQILSGSVLFRPGLSSTPIPAAYKNFTNIPAFLNTAKQRSNFANFTSETTEGTGISGGPSRELFWTTTLKASAESVFLANETLLGPALTTLGDVEGYQTSITYQVIPKTWLQAARSKGGDAIDLDPSNGGIIGLLVGSHWANAADDKRCTAFLSNQIALLNRKAKTAGLYYPFEYLNDAGATQKPFEFYGGGKSLNKLKTIRRRYDPKGVFQTLLPGGFKLGM